MENSIETKAPAKSKVRKENEDIMQHIVELTERVNYVMDMLKNQAHVVQEHQGLIERIRVRMGL